VTSYEAKEPLSIVDVFITYAWTSGPHREWVRLLATALQAMGFNVRVDANLDYGNGVTGFMRQVVEARHVLMIADENYVDRADHVPGSGAYIENGWLREVYAQQPSTWLTVMFKDNPGFTVPAWLAEHNPRGLNYNTNHETGDFPGAEQLVDLWRWLADLPADLKNAVSRRSSRRAPPGWSMSPRDVTPGRGGTRTSPTRFPSRSGLHRRTGAGWGTASSSSSSM
jgi:hypothetical protein